jgi:hypothetical protein
MSVAKLRCVDTSGKKNDNTCKKGGQVAQYQILQECGQALEFLKGFAGSFTVDELYSLLPSPRIL